jgi:hypothetical protein
MKRSTGFIRSPHANKKDKCFGLVCFLGSLLCIGKTCGVIGMQGGLIEGSLRMRCA